MKLGTDAVLLGCLIQAKAPKQVLDIGTGSGIIALQLAQRFQNAHITAIDIEPQAVLQAQSNFERSSWSDRLLALQADISSFTSAQPFDLICCNPPFYANGFPIANQARRTARTQAQLSFEALVAAVDRLLSSDGQFWVILPTAGWELLKTFLEAAGFYLVVEQLIRPKPSQNPNRVVAAVARERMQPHLSLLTIRTDEHAYTHDYIRLTQDFYLQLK